MPLKPSVPLTPSSSYAGANRAKRKSYYKKPTNIKEDRENPFVFKIINETQTKNLLELEVEEVEKSLATILNFTDHSTDLMQASQLDYYVGAIWWAKEQGFTPQQVSAFFTAATQLLLNIKDKHMHILDNLNELREMMAGVGQIECERPGGLDIFEAAQARKISEYFHQSLFQHYKLHQFVFSHTQAEEIIGLDLTCELVLPADVPYPAPLAEGLPHDVWEKYVKSPPPTPPPPTELAEASVGASAAAVSASLARWQAELEMQAQAAEENRRRARLQQEAELAEEDAILSKLTADEIRQVVELVTKDTFKSLNAEMASKLRERENTILTRINKVHKVSTN